MLLGIKTPAGLSPIHIFQPETYINSDVYADLREHNIEPTLFHREDCKGIDEAIVICSEESNTRTILSHTKNISEPTALELTTAFFALPVTPYWIHIEGRNCIEVLKFLKVIRSVGFIGKISVDLERDREGSKELIAEANILFVSHTYGEALIKESIEEQINDSIKVLDPSEIAAQITEILCLEMKLDACLYILWGKYGSFGFVHNENFASGDSLKMYEGFLATYYPGKKALVHSLAYPSKIVETVGAGDSYIAGALWTHARSHAMSPHVDPYSDSDYPSPLTMATFIACRKCETKGFKGLWEGVNSHVVFSVLQLYRRAWSFENLEGLRQKFHQEKSLQKLSKF